MDAAAGEAPSGGEFAGGSGDYSSTVISPEIGQMTDFTRMFAMMLEAAAVSSSRAAAAAAAGVPEEFEEVPMDVPMEGYVLLF